ncbi:hypothetical protein K0M31_010275 [Melipona bicolor]|uniref:Uncharacterized protein n=1 Tax=Melipona bicolor TaxID=60889 RepID=A0AA40FMB5_9HYME|nr:hypothetical protein K0M31_010275 [Melipona bicolor]
MAAEEGALSGGLGAKLKCPTPISRLRVEKIEGGLMVAGVVIAANCQIALPAFGFLFMLVGAVLTEKCSQEFFTESITALQINLANSSWPTPWWHAMLETFTQHSPE